MTISEIPKLDAQLLQEFCSRNHKMADLSILVTERCPTKCKHCTFWKRNDNRQELSLEEIEKLFGEAYELGFRSINITGGDPLMREDIFDILNICYKAGFRNISLNTTGLTLDEKKIKGLISSPASGICFSLDGEEKIHDELRGTVGSYRKVIFSLAELRNKKRTNINMVLTNTNYDQIIYVANIAKSYGATMTIQPFDLTLYNSSNRKNLRINNHKYVDEIEKALCRIKREPSLGKTLLTSKLHIDILLHYLRNPSSVKNPCFVGYVRAHVDSVGNVFACYPLPVIDNIRSNSFTNIWNSERYNELRQKMLRRDCPNCLLNCYTNINIRFYHKFRRYCMGRLIRNDGRINRKSMILIRLNGQALIERYRQNYRIAKDAVLTEDMILRHWELERHLTQELLQSRPESRWETFERCYNTLYHELEWLNHLIDSDKKQKNLDQKYAGWLKLIGPPPKKVYEVGSGKGELIQYLASRGYDCKATEITNERGKKWVKDIPNFSWEISDGVHLERFEPANTYDVVISEQLVEHLHPDDLVEHFRAVLAILVNGGRYIFRTPHVHGGPWDISRVFGCDKPMGMHLKEYTYQELSIKLERAGFKHIYTIVPWKIHRFLRKYYNSMTVHTLCLNYLCIIESLIKILPTQSRRRKAARIASRLSLFKLCITMIAEKK